MDIEIGAGNDMSKSGDPLVNQPRQAEDAGAKSLTIDLTTTGQDEREASPHFQAGPSKVTKPIKWEFVNCLTLSFSS